MAKKFNETNIRKITKLGKYSYAVSLPISVVKEWRWKEKQNVELVIDSKRKTITIKDWKGR